MPDLAQWMLVGFVHGVMNTDNMTISGETIDYGPCAFMEAFDPATVYSSIDHGGRYAYGNQPVVAEWNLARLAEALLPLLHDNEEQAVELAVQALGEFRRLYSSAWSAGMRSKLGLAADVDEAIVTPLVDELLALLLADRVDYTSFFRALAAAGRGDRRRPGPARTTAQGRDRTTRPLARPRAIRCRGSVRIRPLPDLLRHLTVWQDRAGRADLTTSRPAAQPPRDGGADDTAHPPAPGDRSAHLPRSG